MNSRDSKGIISPIRKGSVLSSTSSNKSPLLERKQTLSLQEQISFFPFIVTCFGDYILCFLTSSTRNRYIALWGPESHLCERQELLVESAKVSIFYFLFFLFLLFLFFNNHDDYSYYS